MNPIEIVDSVALRIFFEGETNVPESVRETFRQRTRFVILATLDAIREPSESMMDNDEITEITLRVARAIHSSELPCADIWRAMIDAFKREIVG